jgi:hypothetical protein
MHVFLYRAATDKNRLDATTFKLLNLGLVLSLFPTLGATKSLVLRAVASKSVPGAAHSALKLIHALITTTVAYEALETFGLPSFKMSVVGPLSATYLVSDDNLM